MSRAKYVDAFGFGMHGPKTNASDASTETHGISPRSLLPQTERIIEHSSSFDRDPPPKTNKNQENEWTPVRRRSKRLPCSRERKLTSVGSQVPMSVCPEQKVGSNFRSGKTIARVAKPPFLGEPVHQCEEDRHSVARRRDLKKALVVKTKAGKGRRPGRGRNTGRGASDLRLKAGVTRPKSASNGTRFGEADNPGPNSNGRKQFDYCTRGDKCRLKGPHYHLKPEEKKTNRKIDNGKTRGERPLKKFGAELRIAIRKNKEAKTRGCTKCTLGLTCDNLDDHFHVQVTEDAEIDAKGARGDVVRAVVSQAVANDIEQALGERDAADEIMQDADLEAQEPEALPAEAENNVNNACGDSDESEEEKHYRDPDAAVHRDVKTFSESDEEVESESDEEEGHNDARVIEYFANRREILGPPVVPAGVGVVEIAESSDSEDETPDEPGVKFTGETAEVDVFSNLALCESEAKWLTLHFLPFYLVVMCGIFWCQRFDVLEDQASHTVRGRLHQLKHYVFGLPAPSYFEEYWWSFSPRFFWSTAKRDPITGVDVWDWGFSIWSKERQVDYIGMTAYYYAALVDLIGAIGYPTCVVLSVTVVVYFVYCSVHKWFWGPKRMLVLPGDLDNYIDGAVDNDWCGRVSSTRALHGCEATTVHRVRVYTELYNLLRAEDEFRNVQTTQSDGSFRPSAVPRLKDILRTFELKYNLKLNPEWAANTVSYIVTQEHLRALHCQAKSPSGEERGILNGMGGRRSFQSNLTAGSDAEPSTSGRIDRCQSIVLKCLLPLTLLYLTRAFVSSEARNTSPGGVIASHTMQRENLTPPIELSMDLPSLTAEWYTRTMTGTPPSQQRRESSHAFGKSSVRGLPLVEESMILPDPNHSLGGSFAQLMRRWWSSIGG